MPQDDTSKFTKTKPNFATRARLSSRAPLRKNEREDELRRYPATKVLVPAALHSQSCSSIFSEWDIDCWEESSDGGEPEKEADRSATEVKRRIGRAPIVSFRNSYILSDAKDEYIEHPRSPPVTLSLSPFLDLYPPDSASNCLQKSRQPPKFLDIREKAQRSQKLELINGKSRMVHRNLKPNGPTGDYYYADRTFDGSRAKVGPDQVNIIVNNFTLEKPSRPSDIRLNIASTVDDSNLKSKPIPVVSHSSKNLLQKSNGHLYENPLGNSPSGSEAARSKSTSRTVTLLCNDEILELSSTPVSSQSSSHVVTGPGDDDDHEDDEEDGPQPWVAADNGGSDIPVAVGIFVATVVGTPVFFAAGIKLGMFAGIAGGAMGYTTGKMFADHEEAQAVAKGLVLEEGEEIPPAMRKKQILKRIREWEKFEANCNMLKELEKEKRKFRRQFGPGRRRYNSAGVQTQSLAASSLQCHDLRKVQSEADQLSPTYQDEAL